MPNAARILNVLFIRIRFLKIHFIKFTALMAIFEKMIFFNLEESYDSFSIKIAPATPTFNESPNPVFITVLLRQEFPEMVIVKVPSLVSSSYIPLFGGFYKNVGILLGGCLTVKN